jgi:hypothetical protein
MWSAESWRRPVRRRARRRRRRQRGQAALEILAGLPLLLAAGLLAWQLVAVLGAAQEATERARSAALRGTGRGPTLGFEREVRVPSFLPGTAGLRVRARSAVRAP